MVYMKLAVLQIWVAAADLGTLPSDIAVEAKWAAWNYAWYAANERMGSSAAANSDRIYADNHIDDMRRLGQGLLSDRLVDDFKWMAFNVAWYTANSRAGYPSNQNWEGFERMFTELKNNGLLDSELVDNLNGMVWHASWHAANFRKYGSESAKNDKMLFEHYAGRIGSEVVLKSISFDTDDAKVLADMPEVISTQTLDNRQSGHAQSMEFSYEATEGHSTSWSNTVGFEVGATKSVEASFGVVSAGVELSYKASFSHSWSGGSSEGETIQHRFPLVVPPYSVYEAKATVHQATMEVPYVVTMGIGSHTWTISGIWKGVAVSRATYTTIDRTPGSTLNSTFQDVVAVITS